MRDESDAVLAERASGGDRRALEVLLDRHADRIHARVPSHRRPSRGRARRHPGGDDRDRARHPPVRRPLRVHHLVLPGGDQRRARRAAPQAAPAAARSTPTLPEPRRRRGRRPRTASATRLDVDAALRQLPEDFRVAVVLRDLCDLDYAEIADVLDVPPGTVRSRIARGRALLVEHLGAGSGTRNPPPHVRTTMADDDERDERLAAWLEPEPLDDVTRRRLVATAMREAARDSPGRRGGSPPPRRSSSCSSSGCASGHRPGRRRRARGGDPGPHPRPTEAAWRGRRGCRRASAAPRRRTPPTASPGAPVALGDFGDLDQRRQPGPAPDRARDGAALAAGGRRGHSATRRARPRASDGAPAAATGSRRAPSVAVGTGTLDGRAVRSSCSPTLGDGTRSIDAVLTGPCEVRPLVLSVPADARHRVRSVTLSGNCERERAVADWTTDAVDTLENVVAAVRDKTVVPAQKATKAVVFGLLVAFFVLDRRRSCSSSRCSAVLVVLTGEVWVAYLILGGIFVLAGAFCWTLRSPRTEDANA